NIAGRRRRAPPFNRPPAKKPIAVNSNSARTRPTPIRSKDAKTSQVSSGARPQTTDANANRAEAQIARGKTKSATPPIWSPRKTPKHDVAASDPVAPPFEPNPVLALKQLPQDVRGGKRRRPAILEGAPCPGFPKPYLVQLEPEPKERD